MKLEEGEKAQQARQRRLTRGGVDIGRKTFVCLLEASSDLGQALQIAHVDLGHGLRAIALGQPQSGHPDERRDREDDAKPLDVGTGDPLRWSA